jgi:Glycerol-3-phosphate dehydrogenase
VDHVIAKWAFDVVDTASELAGLDVGPVRTQNLPLVGAAGFSPTGAGELQERFGLDADVASHLHHAYGDRAERVMEVGREANLVGRLAEGHPILEAEVPYAVLHEAACTSTDVLARRTRLAFLDQEAAIQAVARVNELIGDALGWDEERRALDRAEVLAYLV